MPGREDFQLELRGFEPSLRHQAPAERGENTGIPKASKSRKSIRLDPLDNTIRK
jgi:hypothetical protein